MGVGGGVLKGKAQGERNRDGNVAVSFCWPSRRHKRSRVDRLGVCVTGGGSPRAAQLAGSRKVLECHR